MAKDIHVSARIVGGKIPVKASLGQTVPVPVGGAVDSVNGKTGDVVLTAEDVGAISEEEFYNRLIPSDSVSGAVAQFPDGADNLPLKSLVASITGGATGCTITHVGKNLWGKNLIQGNVLIDNLVVGKKYSATAKLKNPNQGTYFYIQRAPKGTEQRTTVGYVIAAKETYVVTFTVADGFDYYAYSNGSYANVTDIQIEEGSATEYEPYHATEIPVTWGVEIQNGTVDVLNGIVTDTDTQTEYQIEAHEVNSLLGSNTFYADTGDTTVEYRADIQRYIDKRLSQ
jgi:hypothetical protein